VRRIPAVRRAEHAVQGAKDDVPEGAGVQCGIDRAVALGGTEDLEPQLAVPALVGGLMLP
jgi:hypothetical protein